MSRLSSLADTTFDVVIIGGGIIGAGIARDAAMQGLSVALFEKADYGGGTTSGSTRLIHGGLRYLEMLDFGLVRTDLREREILLRIAPHLVKPMPFVLPFYRRSLWYRMRMRIGLLLYDILSFDKSLPSRRNLTAAEVRKEEPHLNPDGLQGAASYYDAQASLPERLCLENILDATERGARTFNYAEVVGAVHEGTRITGVRVRDVLNSDAEIDVRAKVVVNASGPWFDRVARVIAPAQPSARAPQIRTTKGIHIAHPPLTNQAMALFSPVDERLVFVIPWLGYSWIGTTDTDFTDDPATAHATPEDVDYVVASVKPFFPEVDRDKIYFTNAGVRALVMDEGSESSVSRQHRIVSNEEAGAQGLVAILGSKLTAYRGIAQDATDRICRLLNAPRKTSSAAEPLPGARGRVFSGDLDSDVAAQVRVAVREEQCARLVDFMFRRTRLGFTPDQGRAAADAVVRLMAAEHGWTDDRVAREVADYQAAIARTQAFRRPGQR